MPPLLGRGLCLPFLTWSLLFSLWSGLLLLLNPHATTKKEILGKGKSPFLL